MKTKRLYILISGIAILIYSLFFYIDVYFYYPSFFRYCSDFLNNRFDLLTSNDSYWVFFSIFSLLAFFFEYIVNFIVAVFILITGLTGKLKRLSAVLTLLFIFGNIVAFTFNFFNKNGQSLFIFNALPNIIYIIIAFILFFSIRYFIKNDTWISIKRSKYKKPLLKSIFVASSIISGAFLLSVSISLIINNLSYEITNKEQVEDSVSSLLSSAILGNKIQEYINSPLSMSPDIASYQAAIGVIVEDTTQPRVNDINIVVPHDTYFSIILNDEEDYLMNKNVYYEDFSSKPKEFKEMLIAAFITGNENVMPNTRNVFSEKMHSSRWVDTVITPINNSSETVALILIEVCDVSFFDSFDINLFLVFENFIYVSFLCFLFCLAFFSKRIVVPITLLNETTLELSKKIDGDEELLIPSLNDDEIKEFGETCLSAFKSTREHIGKVRQLAAEKERYKAEIDIAATIQKSLIPDDFPIDNRLRIFGDIKPAKEVGGDFYDFFFINDYKLAFVICDVSGKGIPASMFLSRGKAITSTYLKITPDLKEAVRLINHSLCENNTTGMFITAFIAVMDLSTGVMEYVNAGHVIPFFKKKNGQYTKLKLVTNLMLARFENAKFESGFLTFEYGDSLFQYTDGLTDATNKSKERIKLKGVEEMLLKYNDSSCHDLINNIENEVQNFEDGEEQFDDITLLSFTYLDNKRRGIKVCADPSSLTTIEGYLEEQMKYSDFNKKTRHRLNTILYELFINIASYAYKEPNQEVEIFFHYDKKLIYLTFIDHGIEFDVTSHKEHSIDLSLKQKVHGGMGIYLVKRLCQSLEYKRVDNKNILTAIIACK